MTKRTFKVSKGRTVAGNLLGDDLGDYTEEELETLVRQMEVTYGEEENKSDESAAESPEGQGLQGGEG